MKVTDRRKQGMTMAPKALAEPTVTSGLDETREYLEFLYTRDQPITVRTLIGYWGFRGRGKHTIGTINKNFAEMNLRTEPPFDSGPLDGLVKIQKLSDAAFRSAVAEQPDDHLLTLSRIPSASFALRLQGQQGETPGYVLRDTPISEAVTVMLRYDFSQLPIIESESRRQVCGVFTWESYAQTRLRGDDPAVVSSAMVTASAVDLHSDLFASVGPIADQGYALVTYQGALAGIVTASDLTRQFEDLTLPFLAVGRCEQELKRVASGKLADAVARRNKSAEEFMFGELQRLFSDNWESLGWSLSKAEFVGWLDATRRLRNSIAHFDNPDADPSADLDSVHRLTKWLRAIPTTLNPAASEIETDEAVGTSTSKSGSPRRGRNSE